MNPLLIPPSPNWYSTNIATCASDGTLLYGALSSIVIISPTESYEESADIKIISYAHYERVNAVCINPQWGITNKRFASIADDKTVKLWNFDKLECISSHKTHTTTNAKLVAVTFAGEDRVISISEDGLIAIWKTATNEVTPIKHILGLKVQVACISSCPHASWLTAVGLKGGLVVLVDMRKDGSVKYKLRGHDKDILGLTWCPVNLNIFHKNKIIQRAKVEQNTPIVLEEMKEEVEQNRPTVVEEKKEKVEENTPIVVEEKKEKEENTPIVVEEKKEEESETVKPKKVNPWVNLKFPDDDEIIPSPRKVIEVVNFEKEINEVKALLEDKEITESENEDATPKKGCKRPVIEDINESSTTEDAKTDEVKQDDTLNEYGFVDETIEEATAKETKENDNLVVKINDFLEDDNKTTMANMLEKLRELSIKNGQADETNNTENSDELPKDYLLASSARDGTICFWRAGSDGRLQKKIFSAKRSRKGYKDKLWITLHWIAPTILLSSGQNSELYKWDLTENELKANIVHQDHMKNLFAIVSPRKIFNVDKCDLDWRAVDGLAAWTIGQDRMILYTTIDALRKVLISYPTLGSYTQHIAASIIDPNRLAIGLSDGVIRLWDLSRPHIQYVTMNEIKLKVNVKILSLAWHPTNEHYLAYGTEEGEVGLVYPNNISKSPAMFTRFFRHAIYKLEWGPLKDSEDFALYVCAEGTLCYYDANQPINDPQIIHIPQKPFITQISWKQDYSLLAIGTKIGHIYIYSRNLDLMTTIYYQKNSIQSIVWHPSATAEDQETSSPCECWLASTCTTNTSIVVYNLSDLNNEKFDINEGIVAELNGHSKHIHTMFWSSFHNGRLASVAEDGIMQIWNVLEKQNIATIININADPILAGIWSPLDENFIVIAGKECALQLIDIRTHSVKTIEEINQLRNKRRKVLEKLKSIKQDDCDIAGDNNKSKKNTRDTLLNIVSGRQNDQLCALADCKLLLARERNENIEANNCVLQLHGAADDMNELLAKQSEQHQVRGKPNCYQHIALLQGNMGNAIKEAIINKTLTPWLISIAPMISFNLWQEACDAYAESLLDNANSDPLEAASYLLASHKVNKAIEVLCSRSLFREALATAKCKMPKDADLINDILQKWANYCSYTGTFEIAAQNYIVMKKYEEAANILYKRMKIEELEFAAELALLADNKVLHETILFSCNELKGKGKNNEEEATEG